MTRRRFIALVSFSMLVVLGILGVGVVLVATRSDRGQQELRGWVVARVNSVIRGRMYLGHISGNFVTGVTIDSLEIRDDQDSLFVATGRIRLAYDVRDLVDRRLHFRALEVEHPNVVLRQHENWTWNFRRTFRTSGPSAPKGPERGFGDYIVIDSAHVRNASFRVTIPWHPDDSLHGTRRDSAIAAALANREHEIRRTGEGLTQTYRWTRAYAAVPHARIAHPDTVGMQFVIDTMHAAETVPPFNWRNVRGVARLLGDSVWMTATHFDLPHSTGRAEGKVWWGSDLPVRYAVRVYGDSVSLSDIAWVYPTLPRTGSGHMTLDIRNERDLNHLDYAITDLDVRTTKSHLTGSMTFEVGGPVLAVHDVKMKADPMDWDLIRTLNGKPFPADWQGQLYGTVTARGGPLNRFYVDAADITFRDAHVPGAVSKLTGHGELDILLPAFTNFHHFSAATSHLDLRTITAIYPNFPKINGVVSGSAVLDSSWLDVRVSDAKVTHVDGPGEPSRATGGGRITYGEKYMAYDLDLVAAPISLTMLARSYPKMVVRGTFSGPVKVKGIAPDLDVVADVSGPAGHITYAGKVDADSLGGYGATGSGTFENLSVAGLAGLASPSSRLAGSFDTDIVGDSLATFVGALNVRLGRSEVDAMRLSGGVARLRFDTGILHVDTLRMEGAPGVLRASGTIGLTRPAGRDSLLLALDSDSLGGLRPYLKALLPKDAKAGADALLGEVAFRGTARGWLDSLALRGSLRGRGLALGTTEAQRLVGSVDLLTVRGHPSGQLALRADTVLVAGLAVKTLSLGSRIADVDRASFVADATSVNGTTLHTAGGYVAHGDTAHVRLDSLDITLASGRWTSRRPTIVQYSPLGLSADTIVLASAAGGRVDGMLNVPERGPARVRLSGRAIPFADLANLAQVSTAMSGLVSLSVDVTGTKTAPMMSFSANATDLRAGSFQAQGISATGRYADRRASLQGNLQRDGRSILDATLSYPVDLTLFSATPTGEPLDGRVRGDSVDLALVQAVMPQLRNTVGKLSLDLAVSGKPARPHLGGRIAVSGGGTEIPAAGVRISGMDGSVTVDAAKDSLTIEQLTWLSPATDGFATLRGYVVFRDLDNPRFDLRLGARNFRAVDKRNVARLDVSTGPGGLLLTGTPESAALAGSVTVARGTIYIPELVNKRVEDVSADEFAQLFDTTDVRIRSLMPRAPGRLAENLRLDGVSVNIGDDVWLKSREANIKLGGSLELTRAQDYRDASRSVLSLSGTLSADRGTYLLDLAAVQREFQVQSGRITFFGTPDFNPYIDVTALYRVKQANRADIGVQARILGNFYPQPALSLTSNDPTISQSDLVGYLVAGKPTAELASNDPAREAADILLPTLGALGSRALRDQLGSVMDLFQIQTGVSNEQSSNQPGSPLSPGYFQSFLLSTRLGGERRLSERLFVSVSTGLCQLDPNANSEGSAIGGLLGALEGKLEYRFPLAGTDQLSIRAGVEPAASALRCGNGSVRGFAQTPQQVGFSIFRSWSF